MALIDRDYMRRDDRSGASSRNGSPDVQRLLKTVKPARLVPASRVPIALVAGILIGAAGTFYILPIL